MDRRKMALMLISLALAVAGIYLIEDPKKALGIFLFVWANNISIPRKLHVVHIQAGIEELEKLKKGSKGGSSNE